MKYNANPKPVEYEPVTRTLLESQSEFQPVYFTITPESHKKTLDLLNRHTNAEPLSLDTLFPSEMWGMARVLSNHFGRLNELAVSKTTWIVSGIAYPGQKLETTTSLVRTNVRKGLSFGFVKTETKGQNDELLMDQLDELLLLHEAPVGFYKEKNLPCKVEDPDISIERRVYFRHNWNPQLWHNNIHSDEYARRFGYESGLPEFVMYMDWIFDALFRLEKETAYKCRIDVPLILPVYEEDKINVALKRNQVGYNVVFLKKGILRLRGNIIKAN